MDESTSALDGESEGELMTSLGSIDQFSTSSNINTDSDDTTSMTIITIAHRLSTIKHAQRVLVLKDGMIVEQGKVNELMRNSQSVFNELIKNKSEN